MNKFIITIISTLFLGVSTSALAQGPDDGYGERSKRQHRGMQGNPFFEQAMRGIKSLDLSDEQKTSIKSIMQTLKADSKSIMDQTRANHMQLRALVTAESYDTNAVATLAAQEGDLTAKRLVLTSQALSEVHAQLTVEQQAELEVMATNRMAKRGERRKQRPSSD